MRALSYNVLSGKKKIEKIVICLKISIIVISSYGVIANFMPFYENGNPYFYGVNSVFFANGQFGITNYFLQEYQREEFIPENWIITEHETAVPMSGTGLMVTGALFYLIGGYYGLFYLSPIFYIILLVASERISSKLFGKNVGLFTLLVVASSNHLFRNSVELQTESIFVFFSLIGVFYFIKFLKTKKKYFLLISSIILTLSSWIKLNGLIAFPLEILVLISYSVFVIALKKKSLMNKKSDVIENNYNLSKKKFKNFNFLKIILIVSIPWMCFLVSHLVFYEYNFGDPFSNYGTEQGFTNYDTSISSIFKFENKDFENIKQYSKYLLPYQIPAGIEKLDENFEKYFGENWVGLIGISSLIGISTISFFTKDKRTEIFVLMTFILGIVWFFSSITLEHRAERGVPGRYMFPAFIFSSMIFGYFVQKIINREIKNLKPFLKIIIKFSKIILVVILGIFFMVAFHFSNPVQYLIEDGIDFKNPEIVVKRFPLNSEGLTENSIIMTNIGPRGLEYGLIPFNPLLSRDNIPIDSVNLLKEILKEGHDVNTFKIPFNVHEKNMIIYFVEEQEIILKDYSETFCKVYLKNSTLHVSDDVCINNESIREKILDKQ